ncbi:MAG: DNA polymerase III subunit delta [Armatimonadota bacterium]|nr:DNA polymerase III subunit delta [Armatimonadota bacterium]MDR5702134.1 DNA polymerase III subunit delta [Armatimonadota bacterium]
MTKKEGTQGRTIYLLLGEEDLLLEEKLVEILQRLVPPGERSWNLDVLYADETPVEEIINRMDTLPFLGGERVVLVKRLEALSAREQERLASYLEEREPPSALVMVASTLDKRRRLYQVAKRAGEVMEFPRLPARALLFHVKKQVEGEGKRISDAVAMTLIALVGNSLRDLVSEVAKLVAYVGDRKVITVQDIQEVCTRGHEVTIFQLVDAIGDRQLGPALGLLREVLQGGEPPLLILFMIARQFRLILQAKALLERGLPSSRLHAELGVPPFLAQRLAEQSRKFSLREVQGALSRLLQADVAIKSGTQPPDLALELAVVDLCG